MILTSLLQSAAQLAPTALHAAATTASDKPEATLSAAIVAPFIVQKLKNASWFPWLSKQSDRINFWVGIASAASATYGIHLTWDAFNGGTLTLPGLQGIWQVFVQWAAQQAAYKGLVVPAETLGDMRGTLTELVKLLTPPPKP